MDIRQLVGRNVRKFRVEKGLTQEEFAVRSGFSQQYLSDLERGRRNPTVVSILELAMALGVPHTALVAPDSEFHVAKKRRISSRPTRARR
jgi:transcriptional regulator with XRE-family HTH domain